MKYWALACQLELLNKGKNPDSLNKRFQILYVTGVIVNVIAGVGTSIKRPITKSALAKAITFFRLVSTIPLLVSCCFLTDAFRRLNKTKDEAKVINKKPVIALSFAYFSLAFALLFSTLV